MMRLRHHKTVTGGTTHGWFTVHRRTVPPAGVPGFHQRDARRVSAARPVFRDRVPRPDGGMADGWETADRPPVYRLQKLPPPDTGRPALIHPGLPQRSYWIPGSWHVRMVYTDGILFHDPSQESDRAG